MYRLQVLDHTQLWWLVLDHAQLIVSTWIIQNWYRKTWPYICNWIDGHCLSIHCVQWPFFGCTVKHDHSAWQYTIHWPSRVSALHICCGQSYHISLLHDVKQWMVNSPLYILHGQCFASILWIVIATNHNRWSLGQCLTTQNASVLDQIKWCLTKQILVNGCYLTN